MPALLTRMSGPPPNCSLVCANARLMLSASVAMSYGGSLAFESREGEGTTVRVWLPRVARKGELPTLSSRTVRPVDVVELRRG